MDLKILQNWFKGSLEVTGFSANNFSQKRVTEARVVSLCSARHGASNDMRFYLFWPNLTLRSRDPRSNFDIDFSSSNQAYVEASRWDERDGVRLFTLALFVSKLSTKGQVFFCDLPDLWRHQMIKSFKNGCHRLPLVIGDTCHPLVIGVFIPSHFLN